MTGLWEDYDEEVEAACRMYHRTTAMYIYKNVFCYICNTNYAYVTSKEFLDINGLITSAEFNHGGSVIYGKIHLELNSFKVDNVIFSLENAAGISTTTQHNVWQRIMPQSLTLLTRATHLNVSFKNYPIDFDSLTSEYVRISLDFPVLFGEPQFCPVNTPIPYPCICDSTCETRILKNTENCCGDFLLAYPVSCIPLHNTESKVLNFWEQVKMITGCYLPQVNVRLKTMCEKNSANAFQQIPVTFGRVTYRNVYCYLCNHPETSNETMTTVQHLLQTDFHLWNITLHGNQFIDTKYFVRADWLFQYAMKMNFYVHFRPDPGFRELCSVYAVAEVPNIVKCNATGRWKETVNDLLWACERIHQDRVPDIPTINFPMMKPVQYKNKFCLACNPGWSEEYFIDECNVTGTLKTLNTDDEFLCKKKCTKKTILAIYK